MFEDYTWDELIHLKREFEIKIRNIEDKKKPYQSQLSNIQRELQDRTPAVKTSERSGPYE